MLCSLVVTNHMYRKYPRFVKMKPTVIQIVGIEIARKKLQKHQLPKSCLLWVLTIPTNCNKETSKFYLSIMLSVNIEFMTTEKKYKMKYKCVKFTKWGSQMKWCQTSFVMGIFSLCKSQKWAWFNTTSHGYYKYSIS